MIAVVDVMPIPKCRRESGWINPMHRQSYATPRTATGQRTIKSLARQIWMDLTAPVLAARITFLSGATTKVEIKLFLVTCVTAKGRLNLNLFHGDDTCLGFQRMTHTSSISDVDEFSDMRMDIQNSQKWTDSTRDHVPERFNFPRQTETRNLNHMQLLRAVVRDA